MLTLFDFETVSQVVEHGHELTPCAAEDDLKLLTLILLPTECQNYRGNHHTRSMRC